MKSFMTFLEKREVSNINEHMSTEEILVEVLSLMQAQYHNYFTNHWQAKGDNYYGNHLLFQRLYEGMVEEIDTLAEKIVAYFGGSSVDMSKVNKRSQFWIDRWNRKSDIVERSINSEKDLHNILDKTYNILKERKDMSLGLDDYIMATANAHETNLYLLQQIKRQ